MAIERREYEEIEELAAAGHEMVRLDDARCGSDSGGELRREALALMSRAARALDDDVEDPARLLEEARRALVRLWCARHGAGGYSQGDALELIARMDPHVALQLELARQESDLRNRLPHCRALLVLVERVEPGLEPLDAGCSALPLVARHVEYSNASRGERSVRHVFQGIGGE